MEKKVQFMVVIIMLMLPVSSFAQQKPFKLGLQVAPGLGWLRPDATNTNYSGEGAMFGLSWGFLSDFALTDNYFVSTGFNLLSNTGKISFPDKRTIGGVENVGNTERKYKLKYVEIPITLKMKTNQFGAFKYFGQIGFGPAFKVSAKADDVFNYGSNNLLNEESDISDETGLLQAGLIFGLGTEYYVDKSTAITGSLIFRNGFTNVLKGENKVTPDIQNNATPFTVQLCIGVIF
ncbi:MAG: PorT family protein [Bacteroidia bacterium]|nr:PorT family protein [Bacteroidia bacterium]